ncbi:hypothetical protein [Coleofasciculus sp. FACHB-T130]|uniref:WD40 domain-containing protein n=1 Tax=Cyanophyceae TaxID=3028117 RepID=UPI0016896E59|nr:hypothetical protein [Coleofasciculus sp. FACHB-T130]MBD1881251.1 hypothetical protein [Coleofasciculus sp. FACHB-T130]
MSDPHQPKDVAAYNEDELEGLAWAIEASVGQFKLFLARCNYTSLRSQLVERLQELTTVEIRILELKTSEKTLYARIQAELDSEQPDALMVFGLESVGDLDELLSATNQVREEFRKNFHFPLVLWLNDEVLKKLLQLAPDFESWATTTEFVVATDELVGFLRETAEQFFEVNFTVTLEDCREIKLACQDLQTREQALDLELRAVIESLLGLTEDANYANRNLDIALEHYQKGLKLWQQSNNLERQGKLLKNIAFCYYLKALRHREIDHPDWQSTQHYIRQCLEVLEQAHRPDLVANSILSLGRVLRRLEDWEQLQTLAQKAVQRHLTENKPIELAQDYGFLAEVALAKKHWNEAKEFAQKALDVFSVVPSFQSTSSPGVVYDLPDISVISYDPSRYHFILAQSQQHLDQPQEAIRNLEVAKEVGSPEHDTQLYLDILCCLQKLYFEQKEYSEAFEIKLEQRSIEQQYGFRAFVGAGSIQPQRKAKFALTQVKSQETIAPEITASGRQLDVERLMERIGRNDCKLIVIHGQSGVGKSSLVNGGLLPTLKQKAIGTQDVLPLSMRVYTSWIAELGRLLAEALVEKKIQSTTSLDSVAAILEQLRQNEARNLRTVLIFDQFEEFFFVYTDSVQRREFFEFLGDCLNILAVKVILSLREDYIHYLLECDRLDSMKIIGNDILTKGVRYPLGNFSPDDAKRIIKRLTENSNFHLEPALIEELMRDLAGKLGEVRPIELQVVGAQLQTENITTLVQYRECNPQPKEELVKRYLAEVVKDCGQENQQAAELVLYLLTDENNTRPLKTRAELEVDLKVLAAGLAAEATKLNLILEIFRKSGLVFLLPESPADRYQLVHDYLVSFIRQQQAPGLLAELAQAKQKQKLTEAQLRQALREKEEALRQEQQERQRAAIAEIEALSSLSQALLLSHDQLGALVAGVKAGRKLQQIEVSSESKTLAAGKLWQAVYSVQERNRFHGHSDWVNSVSFSPDGQMIASASSDGTVKLWRLDGTLLQTFHGHSTWVKSISFSPDGQMIASASKDGTVKLWNLDGTQVQTFRAHSALITSVSFSPDGQMIASASKDGTMKLWNLDGTQVRTFMGHSGEVWSVSFNPDGQTLASTSDDGTVKLWRLDGTQVRTFMGHSGEVWSVSFNPDGQTLASASGDGTVKLWRVDGTLLQTFVGHNDGVNSLRFSPDSQTLASTSDDRTVKLWRLDGTLMQTFVGHSGGVSSVNFSSDGKMIASASGDGTVKLWTLDGTQVPTFQGHNNGAWSVSFSPDGQMIASASGDGTLKIWCRDGTQVQTFVGHSDEVKSVSFSPDGQMIASASDDCTVKLWCTDGTLVQTFAGHSNEVWSVSFSPDGQTLASASDDCTVKLWHTDGTLMQTFVGHSAWVSSVSFSPDGQTLASASHDNTVKLWGLDGPLMQTFVGHNREVMSVSFSADGQMIASASYDRTVKLWRKDGTLVQTFVGHSKGVSSVSFSPDGQTLASASYDCTVKLWGLDGRELQTLVGHSAWVSSVSFSPDGQTLASASKDGTVILWNLNLEDLLVRGCNWLRDYLKTNPNVSESDRHLCDGICN